MDIRQILLLIIALAVPLALFRLKRPDLVVGWVAVTLTVHIFDTRLLTNLPAGRIVGLVYLPLALMQLPGWLRFRPVSAWLLNFVYLLILGVVFGFLVPWPDATENRAWTVTAPGRAVIYPVRLLADLSLMIFLAGQLCKPGMILLLGRMLILGSTLTAAVGSLNLLVPGFDPYALITGAPDLNGTQFIRARGLSFEPRGLGLSCVYGIMITLVYPGVLTLRKKAVIFANLLGLLATFSTSALAVIAVGLLTAWSFLSKQKRRAVLGSVVVIPALILMVAVALPSQFERGLSQIEDRTSSERLQGAVAGNLLEGLIWRLDVFDASGLIFLGTHPQYILTGTGPGEIMLAASNSLPPGIFTLIYGPGGLNGVPNLGLLLEIANSGMIGAALWLVQIIYCGRSLGPLSKNTINPENHEEWKFGKALFFVGTAFFLVQNPLDSPIWPVILSVGWAACRVYSKQKAEESEIVPAAVNTEFAEI